MDQRHPFLGGGGGVFLFCTKFIPYKVRKINYYFMALLVKLKPSLKMGL
jgi:hypothetical protein